MKPREEEWGAWVKCWSGKLETKEARLGARWKERAQGVAILAQRLRRFPQRLDSVLEKNRKGVLNETEQFIVRVGPVILKPPLSTPSPSI